MINEENSSFKECEAIHSKVKFLINSKLRMKILLYLLKSPSSIKTIADETSIVYSSISTNVHDLEKEEIIEKRDDKYYINNIYRIYLINLINFYNGVKFLEDNSKIINESAVSNESLDFFKRSYNYSGLKGIYNLKGLKIIKSSSADIFKTRRIFKDYLISSSNIKVVIPNVPHNYRDILKFWLDNEINVEIILSEEISDDYIDFVNSHSLNNDLIKNNLNLYLIDKIPLAIVISEIGLVFLFFDKLNHLNRKYAFVSNEQEAIDWGLRYFKKIKNSGEKYSPIK